MKEALKSKTVKYVPILIFATLFISGVKISNFEYYVIGHYVISGYVIGKKSEKIPPPFLMRLQSVKI